MRAFQRDIEIQRYVRRIIRENRIRTAVETGTRFGYTSRFLARLVPRIYTIEYSRRIYDRVKPTLDTIPNITFLLGDSRERLKEIIPEAEQPLLVYLDAHARRVQPIISELNILIQYNTPPAVLIIHDCKVPGLPQLTYEQFGDFDITYERLKPSLDRLYGKYRIQYNDWYPNVVNGIGVLFVFPD